MKNLEESIKVIEKNFKGKATDGMSCFYLSDDGKKCVIGCFLPDGHEAQNSFFGIKLILEKYPDLKTYLPKLAIAALEELQQIHDDLNEDASLKKQKAELIEALEYAFDAA